MLWDLWNNTYFIHSAFLSVKTALLCFFTAKLYQQEKPCGECLHSEAQTKARLSLSLEFRPCSTKPFYECEGDGFCGRLDCDHAIEKYNHPFLLHLAFFLHKISHIFLLFWLPQMFPISCPKFWRTCFHYAKWREICNCLPFFHCLLFHTFLSTNLQCILLRRF